jgi:hypothetical protein
MKKSDNIDVELMAKLYNAGCSIREIAKAFDISYGTAQGLLKDFGVEMRNASSNNKDMASDLMGFIMNENKKQKGLFIAQFIINIAALTLLLFI